MDKVAILGGKVFNDELTSPGYVWFRCSDYPGLPDNTPDKIGYFAVYRPLSLHIRFNGHEHITDAMREDAEALYAEVAAIEQRAVHAKAMRLRRAYDVIEAIPSAAVVELREINRELVRRAANTREGIEPHFQKREWDSEIGIEILIRHGVDAGAVASAQDLILRDGTY